MHLSTHESERNLVNSQNTWLLFRRILEFLWQWGNSCRFLVEFVHYYRFILACTRWKVVHLCSHNIIQNTARHGHEPRSQMLSLTFTTSCASGLQKGGNRIDLFLLRHREAGPDGKLLQPRPTLKPDFVSFSGEKVLQPRKQ